MAPHSSTLAWKIPWTEEPGRLQSMGSLGVGHDWATSLSLFTFHFDALEKEMATHSSVLARRIPGTGKPGGLPSMGSHRVGHNWSDLAAAAEGPSTNSCSSGVSVSHLPCPFQSNTTLCHLTFHLLSEHVLIGIHHSDYCWSQEQVSFPLCLSLPRTTVFSTCPVPFAPQPDLNKPS